MKKTESESLAGLLTALAEPVRLRLMLFIERQELTVGELAGVIQLPQSTTSRHLKSLADAGLVKKRSAGPAVFFRLTLDDLAPEARQLWLAVREHAERLSEEDGRRLEAVMAGRKADSQAFFGRIAGEWDQVRTRLFGADFMLRGLLGLLPRKWVVADLGCGTGNAAEVLAPHVERVVAVDNSEAMLGAAKKRLSGVKNVQFLAGSLDRLPLKDSSVDAAVCGLVLHHVEKPELAVKEMARVLRTDKGGGVALIVDMVQHARDDFRTAMGHKHLGFATGVVNGWFKAAGFGEIRVQDLPADPEGRGPGLFVATGRIS